MLRRSPIKRKAPLAPRRVVKRAPAAASARGRKRPTKTAAEAAHHDRVAKLGCLKCKAPATLHHVTSTIHGGRYGRSEKRVVPLCPMHHQKVHDPKASDPVSVEGLSHRGFYEKFGIDLWAEADRLWEESCGA